MTSLHNVMPESIIVSTFIASMFLAKQPLLTFLDKYHPSNSVNFIRVYYPLICVMLVIFISLIAFKEQIVNVKNIGFYNKAFTIFLIICVYCVCLSITRYTDNLIKSKINRNQDNVLKYRSLKTYYRTFRTRILDF